MTAFASPFDILKKRADQIGEKPFVGVTRLGDEAYQDFRFFSWRQVYERVGQYGLFLRSLGLKPGDRIAIQGRNSLEWLLLDWAAMAAGVVTVPLYAQSHPDEVRYILEESEVRFHFVDERESECFVPQMSFRDVDLGASKLDGEFEPSPLAPDEVCSIIYTSGTAGIPKGVMHSAKSFFDAVHIANRVLKMHSKDRLISYLPLSHVAERVLIELGSVYTGAQVFVVDRVEKLMPMLAQARPTIFFGVPRVWDTLRARIEKELRVSDLLTARLNRIPFFLRSFVFSRFMRKRLGLDRARVCLSGAAKLSVETWDQFADWGIRIHEGYGLTETLCVSALNPPGKSKRGSVGKIYPGVDVRIASDGEVCLRAPFHFKGYFKHPEWTEAVIREGWLYTGDIGEFDSQGYLHITDRKKDIFKASNGKYVAPLPIEILLKEHPAIQEAVVFGESRPHCIAVASVGDDLDEESVFRHLEFVNRKLPSHEQIRSLGLIRKPWTPASGELTPSLKVKRKAVQELYNEQINELYETSSRVKYF